MFRKILIANRGEIACRVIQTCRLLGVQTVAVYSDADANSLHVELADEAWRIGGPRPVDSYLRGDVILQVARQTGAEAIHPGYGFLSENADFARACREAGVVFIGPTPEAIDAMGSKSAAKAIMERAGVPIVPGYHGEQQDSAFLLAEAQRIGFPLLIKAIAGGGGKGMRRVDSADEFLSQLEAAQREAQNAFGDATVLLERYVLNPHHIEFQVFGDQHGQAVHLFERECSIQRRHQKILEESPSPLMTPELRAAMGEAAVKAALAIGYVGAGTIEFIVGDDRQFYFMEMNTRLQVEHPVTELVSGQDLVAWQLQVAAGLPLPRQQAELQQRGHAIEVRLYAENPDNAFLPETGTLTGLAFPPASAHMRVDSGVRVGDAVGVFYDPMLAKLIVWGEDRPQAILRLQQMLAQTGVLGVVTNLDFLGKVAAHPAFLAGDTDTGFVATHAAQLHAARAVPALAWLAASARVWLDEQQARQQQASASNDPNAPWHQHDGWRLNADHARTQHWQQGEAIVQTRLKPVAKGWSCHTPSGEVMAVLRMALEGDQLSLQLADRQCRLTVLRHGSQLCVMLPEGGYAFQLFDPYAVKLSEEGAEGGLTAPMPGRVVRILAEVGSPVKKGQPLLILEAMKMEHTIVSPRDGVLESVRFAADAIVEADALLCVVSEAG
ncbi:biotin carboxylase N-terminal domain-containing protein [Leeia sp.]|uniref:acetyl/propionyl/methylcrotonyl-CoA carboxylase subunit alpha n=1 Tax=Leeia sp. TaxID=2884678 RepID=UPI0035AEA17F